MDIKELYKLYQQHPCITTDSRDCPEGSIFLALKGEKFNGNQYALQALEKGCAYAIVDEDIESSALSSQIIKVDNCLQTFKDIAREHRRQFNIPVIGITGTNGKTTTKELIKAVLSEKYNVLATEGNFNNDVGVPKTLLRLNKEHEIAIIEMGASHPGDIKTLVETAEPTCGLITNVGRAHLQGFGSFEGVIKTKGELYDYLRTREDGLVFVNADNDYLCDMLTDEMWCTPYSTDPDKQYACISGEVVSCDPLLKFRWRKPLMELEETGASQKWHKVQTNLIGAYNIDRFVMRWRPMCPPTTVLNSQRRPTTVLSLMPTTPTRQVWLLRWRISRWWYLTRAKQRWLSWVTCVNWAKSAWRNTRRLLTCWQHQALPTCGS